MWRGFFGVCLEPLDTEEREVQNFWGAGIASSPASVPLHSARYQVQSQGCMRLI